MYQVCKRAVGQGSEREKNVNYTFMTLYYYSHLRSENKIKAQMSFFWFICLTVIFWKTLETGWLIFQKLEEKKKQSRTNNSNHPDRSKHEPDLPAEGWRLGRSWMEAMLACVTLGVLSDGQWPAPGQVPHPLSLRGAGRLALRESYLDLLSLLGSHISATHH